MSAVLLLAFAPQAAAAFCLTAPPALLPLQRQIWADPKAALAATQRALARASAKTPAAIRHTAWLYAIEANAYSALERGDPERAAADRGLALGLPDGDPARLELLIQRSKSFEATADVEAAIRDIDAARKLQPPRSAANICAMSAIGVLEQNIGHPERATPILLDAYRAAGEAGLAGQSAAIASDFSAALKRSGDIDRALALNTEEIAWTTANRLTYALANALYFRAQMLGLRHDWRGALAASRRERALSVQLHDEQGIGYADMGQCEALLELGEIDAAAAACAAAEVPFRLDNGKMKGKVTWLEARIALSRHDPAEAIALLDTVLDAAAAATASPIVTEAFGNRAAAHAALGNFKAAYLDLDRQSVRRTAANEAARDRELATMRARFAFDDQARRTATLESDLRAVKERARQQRYRAAMLLGAAGAIVALLGYIVIASRRHRLSLQRLAGDDVLTGLPNRRRITDVANAVLDDPGRRAMPLAIAVIDLDHFKAVNDVYGHSAGGEVLRGFAAAATGLLRRSDALGRWGGEEFLLVLPATGGEAGRHVVERLRRGIAGVRFAFAPDLRLTFSAGVAASTTAGTVLGDLVHAADAALYRAKAAGRNQVHLG